MTKFRWWIYHDAWIGIFQSLVVPLPILAFLRGRPRYWRTSFATIPMTQVALQYVLAHRALEGRLTTGIGLHAVSGAILLIVATFLAIQAVLIEDVSVSKVDRGAHVEAGAAVPFGLVLSILDIVPILSWTTPFQLWLF